MRKIAQLGFWILLLCIDQKAYALADFPEGSSIRDVEIETVLHSFTDPIFQAAQLDPKRLQLYLVVSPQINAFTTSGEIMVIFSGLIEAAEKVEEFIGVVAHETGHIAGGHSVRLLESFERSSMASFGWMLLGAIVGTAASMSGNGDGAAAGAGIASFGAYAATANAMSHSRSEESSADQAAAKYLKALHWPLAGLYDFFKILGQKELVTAQGFDPILRTHPLTQDRLNAMEQQVKTSPPGSLPKDFQEKYSRVRAKIYAFVNSPAKTLRKYPTKDTSFAAHYARAIAYFKQARFDESFQVLDQLVQKDPNDSFLQELIAEIAFAEGNIPKARKAIEQAVRLNPAPLFLLTYAQILLAKKPSSVDIQKALTLLIQAEEDCKEMPLYWYLRAIGYGLLKQYGEAALALAQKALLEDNRKEARAQATRATQHFKPQTPGWIQAQDILITTDKKKEEDGNAFLSQLAQYSLTDRLISKP